MVKRTLYLSVLLITASLFITACTAATTVISKPSVTITSPPSNSGFHAGEMVSLQSTAIDPNGISRVELTVDGNVVRSDTSPLPQTSFTVIQTWVATPGDHLLTVRAVNVANVTSEPAAIAISVLPNAPAPTPTATSVPNRACVNDAEFLADVTVPDGTALVPGQSFNKIWRVRNNGTCTWSVGDVLVFIGGATMAKTAVIAVPRTGPGGSADLLVAMTAPENPGFHSSSWRLKNSSGAFFGGTFDVKINVVAPVAVSCPFTPVIESFTITPTTITKGQSAVLSWGAVIGAERADINNDIGGVATPGSLTVNPTTTTTYSLIATCRSKVKTAHVTLTVVNPPAH